MTPEDLNDFFLSGSPPPSFDTPSSPKQSPQSHPTTHYPIPIHTPHPFDSSTAGSESWLMHTYRQSIPVQISWNRSADFYQEEPGSIINLEDQWGENGEPLDIGGGNSRESQPWFLDELWREIPEQTGMEVSTQPAHYGYGYSHNSNLTSISLTPLHPPSSKESPSHYPHHHHMSQYHQLFLDRSRAEKKDRSRNSSLDAQWSGSPRVSPLGRGGRGFQPPQREGGGEREWREYLFQHMGSQEEGGGGEEIV